MPGDRTITSDAIVRSVGYSTDGELLSGLCADTKMRVWNLQSGKLERAIEWDKAAKAAMIGPGGRLLILTPTGQVEAWNPQGDSQTPNQYGPFAHKGGRLAVSHGLDYFAAASRIKPDAIEEAVHAWDETGREIFKAPSGFGGIASAAFSLSGSMLVVASYDTNVRAWSTRDGELLKVIEDIPVAMFAASFSPDGKLVALAGADRTVYIYEMPIWKLSRKIEGQPEMIASLAWSPDSRRIVTGGFNVITEKHPVSVIVWDAFASKKVRAMPAPHVVRSVAFAPDGKSVAAAAGEKTVNVWAVPV